ncbi:MAG: fibronectin type III domain-containing protein, partial [Eubacteriales bacterium]|nr:fibronectin type III domain-containing protein [Eubacteriales bacterium]
YFTIKPKATSISSLKAGSKKFTVKWYKRTTQTTGYQVQYSTSSKFTSPKTVTISKTGTTSKTISKLKAKKKYYVRVRTYKTVNGTKYYSSWSKAKYVTTKS